ncbi:hypothetical protein ACFQ07_23475, partial [Actinomadura adrarensis]
ALVATARRSGPAATWARSCTKGQPVGIIDEGIGYNPPPFVSARSEFLAAFSVQFVLDRGAF